MVWWEWGLALAGVLIGGGGGVFFCSFYILFCFGGATCVEADPPADMKGAALRTSRRLVERRATTLHAVCVGGGGWEKDRGGNEGSKQPSTNLPATERGTPLSPIGAVEAKRKVRFFVAVGRNIACLIRRGNDAKDLTAGCDAALAGSVRGHWNSVHRTTDFFFLTLFLLFFFEALP